jgi:hypothetical protein
MFGVVHVMCVRLSCRSGGRIVTGSSILSSSNDPVPVETRLQPVRRISQKGSEYIDRVPSQASRPRGKQRSCWSRGSQPWPASPNAPTADNSPSSAPTTTRSKAVADVRGRRSGGAGSHVRERLAGVGEPQNPGDDARRRPRRVDLDGGAGAAPTRAAAALVLCRPQVLGCAAPQGLPRPIHRTQPGLADRISASSRPRPAGSGASAPLSTTPPSTASPPRSPHISAKCAEISPVVKPLANNESTTSSTPESRRCRFDQATQDVGLESAEPLRQLLHDHFACATTTTMSRYHESADDVPDGLSVPRWSWDCGAEPSTLGTPITMKLSSPGRRAHQSRRSRSGRRAGTRARRWPVMPVGLVLLVMHPACPASPVRSRRRRRSPGLGRAIAVWTGSGRHVSSPSHR